MFGFEALASLEDHCKDNPMKAIVGPIISNCCKSHLLQQTISFVGKATGDMLA